MMELVITASAINFKVSKHVQIQLEAREKLLASNYDWLICLAFDWTRRQHYSDGLKQSESKPHYEVNKRKIKAKTFLKTVVSKRFCIEAAYVML